MSLQSAERRNFVQDECSSLRSNWDIDPPPTPSQAFYGLTHSIRSPEIIKLR